MLPPDTRSLIVHAGRLLDLSAFMTLRQETGSKRRFFGNLPQEAARLFLSWPQNFPVDTGADGKQPLLCKPFLRLQRCTAPHPERHRPSTPATVTEVCTMGPPEWPTCSITSASVRSSPSSGDSTSRRPSTSATRPPNTQTRSRTRTCGPPFCSAGRGST